jgi:hypothetical protein
MDKQKRDILRTAARQAQELAHLLRAIAVDQDGYRPQDRLDILNAQFEALASAFADAKRAMR